MIGESTIVYIFVHPVKPAERSRVCKPRYISLSDVILRCLFKKKRVRKTFAFALKCLNNVGGLLQRGRYHHRERASYERVCKSPCVMDREEPATPFDQSPLCAIVKGGTANICLPNICFSISILKS